MTNTIAKAADILRNGWCKNISRLDLPEGTRFCASGALLEAHGYTWDLWLGSDMSLRYAYVADIDLVAEVIRSEYSEFRYGTSLDTVVHFNDNIASSADEVIAVFEKAAVRKDELV